MRQRRVKDLDTRMGKLKDLYIDEPKELKGHWQNKFMELRKDNKKRKIYLEIGCGKGQFIKELALRNPEDNFIAIEAQPSVIVLAMEKAKEEQIKNIIFLPEHMKDIRDYFQLGEIQGIYLNFSDPWHKKRHSKRRLTHRNFLEKYREILDDGFIKIKTDNDNLFNFTLEEVSQVGSTLAMKPKEVTRDLHISPYRHGNIVTEYEHKFSSRGKNINYINIKVGGSCKDEDSLRK